MKKTTQSIKGTSFHDITIKTTVQKLISKLGELDYIDNTGEDNVNYEWDCETENGDVFTIYDWKYYRPVSEDEIIDFHIGSKGKSIALEAKAELIELLFN